MGGHLFWWLFTVPILWSHWSVTQQWERLLWWEPHFCQLPFPHMWMTSGKWFFFFNLPYITHIVSHSLCVSLPTPHSGIHEFIAFVPAPFPQFQVTLKYLKSISGFFGQGSWLKLLTAEEAVCSEGGRRLMDAAGALRCCGEKKPVGICCWLLGSTLEWRRVGMGGQRPLPLLNLVGRVWGEAQNSYSYECRLLVLFSSSWHFILHYSLAWVTQTEPVSVWVTLPTSFLC